MNTHEPTPMFETYNPAVFELDYGLLLKEWYELEKEKATDAIPRTVAHFVSPQVDDVACAKETAAQHMKSFGMDVIPILGESFGYDLGLILEHQADPETDKFEELVEEVRECMHQLGWRYDGNANERVEESEFINYIL